jgi:hypothetical protein
MMFEYKKKLKRIHGDFSNVTTIGIEAFYRCNALLDVPYMPKIDSIGRHAFRDCQSLTKFTFYKIPTGTIENDAFSGCIGMMDIYCPWAEGEVANAPWGATNATIHYNSEG